MTFTISGRFHLPDGQTAAGGTLTIRLDEPVIDPDGSIRLDSETRKVGLDGSLVAELLPAVYEFNFRSTGGTRMHARHNLVADVTWAEVFGL